MRGVFKVAAPEEMDIALTVTGTLKEWRQILGQLDKAAPGSAPDVLGKQIRDLIRGAEKSLDQASWTTGYATGKVTEND